MLHLVIEGGELFNEETSEFTKLDDFTIDLEHSLVSLSKWESKYEKPFLSRDRKSLEETLDYISMMSLTQELSNEILQNLTSLQIDSVTTYIESPQSATTFTDFKKEQGAAEVVTSEIIYYWMVTFQIPFSCETWHLNRLLSLIKICSIKSTKQKKMSRSETARMNRDLNAERKKQLGTSG